MSAKIAPITTAPAAFSGIVAKLNEVIAANPPLQAGKGISITDAKENRIIAIKLNADDINQALLIKNPPFTLYAGAGLTLGITPGLVNQISPTFTDATAGTGGTLLLSSVPPPLLTITATTYFWLKCVGTFGSPDTYVVTVESNGTGTVPAAEAISGTGFTSYLSLGPVVVSGGAITSTPASGDYASSNLGVESYGNINNWWAV